MDTALAGRYVSLTTLTETHIDEMWPMVSSEDVVQAPWWEYLHTQPFTDYGRFKGNVQWKMDDREGVWFAIIDAASQKACGWVGMRHIDSRERKGNIGIFLPARAMQRTPRATETLYLMMRYAFDKFDFERIAWESDGANIASRNAAERLGFALQEVIKSAAVVEGKDREQVFYTLTKDQWRSVRTAIERWLDPINFDEHGMQKERLQKFTTTITA